MGSDREVRMESRDIATNQIQIRKDRKKNVYNEDPDRLTTAHGAPVGDKLNSLSVGPRGPLLLQDHVLIEELAHFDRERIPERVVHARGAGAFGYFKLTLNRNPRNYFAEVEQLAFSPAHLVPGIEPSPDKMLQGRLFSYNDTHRHRLGTNFLQIPVNCP